MVITEWQFHETDFIPVVGREVGDGYIQVSIYEDEQLYRDSTEVHLCYQETSKRILTIKSNKNGIVYFKYILANPLYYMYAHYMKDREGEPLESSISFTRPPKYQGAFADFIVAKRYELYPELEM